MRLTQLSLPSPDPAAQGRFYRRLGLPVRTVGNGVEVTLGWSRLSFAPGERPQGHAEHFAFSLPWDRFEAARSWLSARVPLRRDETGADSFDSGSWPEAWRSRAVYFDDPDGNILELIAHRGLEPVRGGDFGPDELLGLAEFGVAVRDVPGAVATLAESLHPPERSEDSPSFMWLGGRDGRLIVVRRGRVWFPDTGIPASPGPFRLRAETAGGEVELTEATLPA